ncbi:pentatricopeptide repeat-containing protein At2g27610 [Rhododendron vialii]|uniref:pentatricopeptide repeat-containing protein At2g27610 n=1 Tax=Rhododendron vialii TaxID=182163 RepID=UPI00265F1453|nr:pentatricopeptide repeat-containing protein At2g27610 [Rhododendron vialii]
MLSTKLLPNIGRTRATFTSKCLRFTTPTTTSLTLDSYRETSFQSNVYARNRVIDNQIKSGALNTALKLFDEMPIRDVVTWNLVISGCGRYGHPSQALCLYNQMISQGIKESGSTLSSVLSICCDAGLYDGGIQVHSRVIVLGFSMNHYVASSLVDLYMHIGLVGLSLKLFNDLSHRNLAVWNSVLHGFCELGRSNDLLGSFFSMNLEGVEPNGLSFCYLIRGCGSERLLDEGKQLHCCAFKLGWVAANLFVANALVDFYSACGCFVDAKKSFETIPLEDVISWNSVVSVYAENGFVLDALEMFTWMQLWGKRPSVRSFLGFLGLSSWTQNLIIGRQIHCCVLKSGFDCGSVHVQSALIDMYGKCGEIDNSVSLFESVPARSLGCCNSLMTSLLYCGIIEDVVEMFGLMLDEGIGFDEVSLSTTLKALSVSISGSLASCTLVHCCAIKSGFESEIAVSCSLIDAYSKSGHVTLSQQVFEKLSSPNVICFTAIINGYARNGMARKCLELLGIMIQRGLKLDKVTFLAVLIGCDHAGLVEEGKMVFDSMKSIHGIEQERQHYSCLVDLLGRAGLLDEAEELIKQAPVKGASVMWSSLLHSCRVHKNETVGHRAAEILMELEPENHAAWFQASKFYSEIGDFEMSVQVKEIAMAKKMRKEIGYSLIEVNDHICH